MIGAGGRGPAGVQIADKVVYTAGAFVPATTGTFPNNFAQTGIAYDKASTEKACMPLFAPASWPSVNVGILALAATFQSGNVLLRLGSEGGSNDVTITVTGSYIGNLSFPTPLSWSAASAGTPFAGLQFTQFPLSRIGGDAADTLDDDFAVLAVVLTPGS